MNTVIKFPQRNGIPIVGFGAGTKWQWKKKRDVDDTSVGVDPDLVNTLKESIAAGFRHLDTAEFYTTRRDIGQAIKEAIEDPNIPIKSRNEIFVTDKYSGYVSPKPVDPSIKDTGNATVIESVTPNGEIRGPLVSMKNCLSEMELDYIDMFLFHTVALNPKLTLKEQWEEMIQLKKLGLVKIIGVSNYDVEHLNAIKDLGLELPQVLQIEFHPYLQSQSVGIKEYAKANNITLEAYAPLAPLTKARDAWNELIERGEKPKGSEPPLDPLLRKLQSKYGVSETQILLRYTIQSGFIPITTSSKRERMDDILGVINWELDDEDVQKLSDAGNSWFFRAFVIPPLPTHDEQLKAERKDLLK